MSFVLQIGIARKAATLNLLFICAFVGVFITQVSAESSNAHENECDRVRSLEFQGTVYLLSDPVLKFMEKKNAFYQPLELGRFFQQGKDPMLPILKISSALGRDATLNKDLLTVEWEGNASELKASIFCNEPYLSWSELRGLAPDLNMTKDERRVILFPSAKKRPAHPVRLAPTPASILRYRLSHAPQVASSGLLFVKSDLGERIAQGRDWQYSTSDSKFTLYIRESRDSGTAFSISISGPQGIRWDLNFASPKGQKLKIGIYENAGRVASHLPKQPGFDISGDGRSCSKPSSSFRVQDITDGANGEINSFAADFEQRCEGGVATLKGSVRFKSASPGPT